MTAGASRGVTARRAEWSAMTSEPGSRRRRRRRAVWRAGAGISRPQDRSASGAPLEPAADGPVEPDVESSDRPSDQPVEAVATTLAPADDQPSPPPKRRRGDLSERGLRDLVGGGPSQVGPVRAMRARDVNRPDAAELAEADENVVVVRRNWKPPKP